MTVPQINSNISDDSDEMDVSLPPEVDIYRRKYQLLLERCEVLQQDIERIVHRIHQMKRMTRRYKKEIKFLMNRLDNYADDYRNVASSDDDVKPALTNRRQVFAVPKSEKGAGNVLNNTGHGPKVPAHEKSTGSTKKAPVKRKARADKPKIEKDPNAPKKPCNAFFQFCQEQRPLIVAASCINPSSGEPSKQEVTKQLALKWKSLSEEAKQVYVAMFERSKEKYAIEMTAYNSIKKE